MALDRSATAVLSEEAVTALGLLLARPLAESVGDELGALLVAATKRRPRRSRKTGRSPRRSATARRSGGPAPMTGGC